MSDESAAPLQAQLRTARRHPSAVLLVVQLLSLLAYPFLGESSLGRALLGVVGIVMVLVAIWAVRYTPALGWVAVVLGGPALVFTLLEAWWPHESWIVLVNSSLHAPFYFYVSYAMLRYLFHDDDVTVDELYCTGAAFTVVAWGFAYVFAIVQVLSPGSFVIDGGPEPTWFELLYLSFTTLTSVGLSDVLPVLQHARSVVMVEQVAGVMYVALVIARMVGLASVKAARRRSQ